MDVSVIVPTRNRSALLADTLRSALAQRDVDFEVIVVDEASSDETPALLAAFDDPRLRVVRHEAPRGVSVARNRGACEARAEWLAFLDDDDLWAPEKLALQRRAARTSGVSWVYTGHVNINVHHRVTGGAPPLAPDALVRELPRQNVVPGGCSGVMVSKQAFEAAGRFNPDLQPLADWDLWLRLARTGAPACVAEPLVAYRVHGHQMSLDFSRVETEFRMLARHNPDANAAVLFRYLGWWALRVNDRRTALRLFLRAWLERRPEYGTALAVGDIRAIFGGMFGQGRRQAAGTDEPWRARGQAWIDALMAARG